MVVLMWWRDVNILSLEQRIANASPDGTRYSEASRGLLLTYSSLQRSRNAVCRCSVLAIRCVNVYGKRVEHFFSRLLGMRTGLGQGHL